MSDAKEIHLKLTVDDMVKQHQTNKDSLLSPRFYHFTVTALQFHEASLITFTRPDGTEVVIKDRFGRTTKK